MAITAKFEADFQSFYTAVQQAEVSLKSFEQGGAKVESQLSRLTNSLSGTKLIQDATLMAEAVERVGGVSTLTEKELARVSAQASEAAAKLTAMGKDVPPGIQAIADATKGATSSTFDWRSALTSVAGVFGVAFSINAVKNWTVEVIAAGAHIGDLAAKLGVSTEAVQRWEYAANLSGATIANVDRAVATMNRTLSEGSTSTVAVLEKAGLSFAEIRAMRPEEAFNAITAAVERIEDPMLRAEVATKLFGKAGQELLPAIADGFVKAAEGAEVMSAETIARLKDAEDAWTKLSHWVTIQSGEMIANAVRMTDSWQDFYIGMMLPADFQAQFREGFALMTKDAEGLAEAMAKIPPISDQMGVGLRSVALSADEAAAVIRTLDADLNKSILTNERMAAAQAELAFAGEGWRSTLAALDVETVKAVEGYLKLGASQSALATVYGLTTLEVKAVSNALKEKSEVLSLVEPKLGSLAEFIRMAAKETEIWNSGLRFTSEVVGTLIPELDAMAESTKKVGEAMASQSTQAFGGASVSFGNEVPGSTEWYVNGQKRLSEYLRGKKDIDPFAGLGLTQPGDPITVTTNINGILLGSDPSARQELLDIVNQAVRDSLGPQGKGVGA